MSFRMLLIAGHGKNVNGTYDSGAVGCGYEEAKLTRELVNLVKAEADRQGVPCDAAPDRNTYSFLRSGGTMDFKPYTYVLEIHFNAGGTVDAAGDGHKKGSMFYISRSEKGHSVEDGILANLYALGSVKAWDGVVVAQRQWPAGLLVQERVRTQGVSHGLLETCFVSDRDDMNWYQANKGAIAAAIVSGVVSGFKLSGQSGFASYMVKVTDAALNIRAGAGVANSITGVIRDYGCYTIVAETKTSDGETWGKLKSGAGWINLRYTRRV